MILNIREIFIYSYRLIYKIHENTVLFVAVVHAKRLLENHEKSITRHSSIQSRPERKEASLNE